MASTRRPPTAVPWELFFLVRSRFPKRRRANHQRSRLQCPGRTGVGGLLRRGKRRGILPGLEKEPGHFDALAVRTASPRAACLRASPACKTRGDCSATHRPRGRSRNSGPRPGGKRSQGRRWARGRRGGPCRKASPGDRAARPDRETRPATPTTLRRAAPHRARGGPDPHFWPPAAGDKTRRGRRPSSRNCLGFLQTAQNPFRGSPKATPRAIAAAARTRTAIGSPAAPGMYFTKTPRSASALTGGAGAKSFRQRGHVNHGLTGISGGRRHGVYATRGLRQDAYATSKRYRASPERLAISVLHGLHGGEGTLKFEHPPTLALGLCGRGKTRGRRPIAVSRSMAAGGAKSGERRAGRIPDCRRGLTFPATPGPRARSVGQSRNRTAMRRITSSSSAAIWRSSANFAKASAPMPQAWK